MDGRDYLDVIYGQHFTEIKFLKPCALDWSIDSVTWHRVLEQVPAGTIYRDFESTENKQRSYTAIDGTSYFTYSSPEATWSFLAMMKDLFS